MDFSLKKCPINPEKSKFVFAISLESLFKRE